MKNRLLAAVTTASLAAGCGATEVPAPHLRAAALRAMTYNIQSGSRGLDGVASVIRSVAPDVLALQEVDRFSRRANGLDQAAELAARAGMPYHLHFRATDYYGGAYGVALVSRYPLEDAAQVALPNSGGQEPRTVGRARIAVGGKAITIYVTHLSHLPTNGGLRASQSRAILGLLEQDPNPKIVMGDLNDGEGSDAVRILRGALQDAFDRAGEGDSGTYPLPLFLPAIRLDYVLASPELSPVKSFVLHASASDHYPLVAEFEIR